VTRVVSTGSGIALPFFVAAEARGIRGDYIESAARPAGPSLTGRLLGDLPRIHLTNQYESWAHGRWQFGGSVFDDYSVVETVERPIRKVVVTVGTMRTYGFRRLLRRLSAVLPPALSPGAEVLWQTGCTDLRDLRLPGRAVPAVPHGELKTAIGEADLVIAHAGVGSALTVLDTGKRPLLVPRRASHSEHVDDHQALIARDLDSRGLAVWREADVLTTQDLVNTASARVRVQPSTERFKLCN
jgi:UDP-N-acetylglucosamine transferase subunit ALG13